MRPFDPQSQPSAGRVRLAPRLAVLEVDQPVRRLEHARAARCRGRQTRRQGQVQLRRPGHPVEVEAVRVEDVAPGAARRRQHPSR